MSIERVLGYGKWTLCGLVFAVSFAVRAFLDLIFQSRFGWHAVNHAETWFYTGVLEGTHLTAHGIKDPTVWFLRFLGGFFTEDLSIYGVFFAAVFLSSLTSSLIFLLLYELYGKKTALVGGLAYAGMIEPLALSLSGFTHDHLQLPVMLASMVFAVKAVKSRGYSARLPWIIAYFATVYHAYFINEVILVGVGVTAVWVCYQLLEAGFLDRLGWSRQRLYMTFLGLAFVGLLAVHFSGEIYAFLVGKLEDLPQGRMGSADVLPLNLLTFWLRYNILLFIIPFGFIAAYQRRDLFGLCLTATGLMVALVMDRGTRISDIGVAMLVSYALVDWDMKVGRYCDVRWLKKSRTLDAIFKNMKAALARSGSIWYKPSEILKLCFGRKLRVQTTVMWSCLVFAYMWLNTQNRMEYTLIFLVGGVFLLGSIWHMRKDAMVASALSIIVILGIVVNIVYVTVALEPRKIITDSEYRVLDWLGENNRGGRILAGWDRGYMLEVVSGLDSVSSPNIIDYEIHDSLWNLDRQCALKLKKAGVNYVLLNSENFNVVKVGGELAYRITGGLLMTPKNQPPIELTNRIAVYKLRQNLDTPYFKLLRERVDEVSGIKVFLYEVDVELTQEERMGSIVGAIAVNYGKSRKAKIEASVSSEGRTYSKSVTEQFEENDVVELVYAVEPELEEYVCDFKASPIGETWGLVGTLTYENLGGPRTEELNILLIDERTGERLDVFTKEVSFKANERKVVKYMFDYPDVESDYVLGTNSIDGLMILREQAKSPNVQGVGFLANFC